MSGLEDIERQIVAGPPPPEPGKPLHGVRAAVRDQLLRTLRPYSAHASSIDRQLLYQLEALNRRQDELARETAMALPARVEALVADMTASLDTLREDIRRLEQRVAALERGDQR